jgi:hypothetical protein
VTTASLAAAGSALRVRRYVTTDADAVARLNARLRAAGVPHVLYPENEHEQSATERPSWVRDRLFVAAQDDEIRAGLWLKEQDFWIDGRTVRAGWAKYPVSESLIDKAFAGIPGSLLFQVMREQPRLMALGLGGHDGPFARLLAGMRWPGLTIPFFVRVVRPARVARELTALRTTRARAMLLDVLAYSGLATVGGAAHNAWRAMHGVPQPRGYTSTVEESFDDWADTVWSQCRSEYGFLATRDAAALGQTYTGAYEGVTRLRVDRGGTLAGWACLHRMDGRRPGVSSPFGKLVVGVLADCLAGPRDAAGVAAEATRVLVEQGADLLISHQSHPEWGESLERCGWLRRPSNFAFYRARAMESLIGGAVRAGTFHLTRGDCDGLMRF